MVMLIMLITVCGIDSLTVLLFAMYIFGMLNVNCISVCIGYIGSSGILSIPIN